MENKFASMAGGESPPVVWKRHDLAGHETCRVLVAELGWRLTGVAVFAVEARACRLDYVIDCDQQWKTKSAVVTGWVGDRVIDVRIRREGDHWYHDGQICENVNGCVDIDLNFSPSTNLLPIRRLNLGVGETAKVRAAWLRFPSFRLEPLDQTYRRVQDRQYRYESGGGKFVADLTVDEIGLVFDYGQLWSRESAS
jgi:hypothetical protein